MEIASRGGDASPVRLDNLTPRWPPKGLMIEARGRIPPDETFAVAVGERQEGWTDLTAAFAESYGRYFLLPRRAAPDAPWILCRACDRGVYPGAEPVWEGEDGLALLRIAR